jgi:hypothetical protein
MSFERAELGLQVSKGRKRIWITSLVIALVVLLVLPLGYRAYEQWIFAANVTEAPRGRYEGTRPGTTGPPTVALRKGEPALGRFAEAKLVAMVGYAREPRDVGVRLVAANLARSRPRRLGNRV